MLTLRRTVLLCFLLSLAGVLIAGYLSFLHLALLRGDLPAAFLCGKAGSFLNCHAVAASRFGNLFGIPVAFWGVLGYLLLATLSLIAWIFPDLRRQALTGAAALAAFFLALDAGLLAVMLVKIRALCLLCVAMYAIKGLILLTVKRGLGRRWGNLFKPIPTFWLGFRSPSSPAAAGLLSAVFLTGLVGLLAVHFTAEFFSLEPDGLRDRILQRMRTAERVEVDPGDSPRAGSPSAPVQAVMFTDPACPLCREAEEFNAIALKAHRGKLSIVVKQYPSDPEGQRLGVGATPTFFVNGIKILGAITPVQFDEIIREEENRMKPTQGEKS